MRRWLTLFILLLGIYVGLEGLFRNHFVFEAHKIPSGARLAAASSSGNTKERPIEIPVKETESFKPTTPEEAAIHYLEANRKKWNLKAYHDFRPLLFKTPLGNQVKFSIFQGEIPIVGMDIEINVSKNLKITGHTNRYRPIERLDTKNTRPFSVVTEGLSKQFDIDKSAQDLILLVGENSSTADLAYVVGVKNRTSRRPAEIVIRATDGQILRQSFSRGN